MIITKGENRRISTHIHAKELDCKCSYNECSWTMYNQLLIDMFEEFRLRVDEPILITSAMRCQRHNSDPFVGGKPNSKHLIGCAMDLFCPENVDFNQFVTLAKLSFKLSGVYIKVYWGKSFIHVQIEP